MSMFSSVWLAAAGAAVAAGVSWAAMPAYIRWAERRHIVDVPNLRSSHAGPVPRGGGVWLVATALLGAAVAWTFAPAWPMAWLGAYIAGSVAIAIVSWIDDVRGLGPAPRLLVHTAAALLVTAAAAEPDSSWLWWGAAIVGIVGLTNAYNFMDGIDGLAAAQAVVAGAGWIGLGLYAGDALFAALGALLAGGAAGFLVHNRPPARVFMGDVGAAFLGFSFAALTLLAGTGGADRALAGLLFLFPFLFDTGYTLVRRLLRKENPFRAHRSHLYQRQVASGRPHGVVVRVYTALALLGVALAWQATMRAGAAWPLVWPVLAIACLSLVVITHAFERSCRRGGSSDPPVPAPVTAAGSRPPGAAVS